MNGRYESRLVVSERPARRDHLHGSWCPRSTEVGLEPAPMLSMAAKRFSSVRGVTLNRDEWFDPTGSWRPLGLSSVNVIWYGLSEANRAVLYCGDQRRIRLLVLPPDIAEDVALAATFLTCTPGNSLTTLQALATARARSTARG